MNEGEATANWSGWRTPGGDGLDNFVEIAYQKKTHLASGGGVARITLNKPDKMNTLTLATVDEMFRAFYDANHDPMVGVIIVAASGKHFGAGGDVEWERWGLREAFYNRYPHNRLMRMSRKPIIAQVQGYCLAGHNHMAYCCDFTIAADNAVFGQAGPRVSSPADGFFVPYLSKVVGAKKAREMWMLCRKYPAAQALEMGLVNCVVPLERLEAEVDQWCAEMLALSPGCLEVLKAAFDQEMDGYRDPCITSAGMYPDWFDMPEGKEGGAAFMAKRKPEFWDIRRREAEARAQLLADYEAQHKN
ncbi:MAG: enoyl-CoA hydratase/isomerase family protein [Gammaproteobacteria bacterium]|jgi:naphthoate synthase/2-ketocyclohexanecarboxyl-CoA hydrolase|nr:enoyl-CoA hydratase/isomerase family protein [Gammaproteobacteria bacterium]MBP6050282.1 enoyl-CoA hydratase/isomerase family protein [Pseudomonadales bacterium]MBK6583799.1 enoyl-CoA hydratase/isomerase family protein [Gammaproteobacteria bacterium]MBK7522136.1 enoyl-CoA hydratase/isomerase family protein [Gammaproteobacteria bacterium]MBK7727391.1 enoyl-CoA hydratase/isomerase family protein [Gammaproteobacteria bacterium]